MDQTIVALVGREKKPNPVSFTVMVAENETASPTSAPLRADGKVPQNFQPSSRTTSIFREGNLS